MRYAPPTRRETNGHPPLWVRMVAALLLSASSSSAIAVAEVTDSEGAQCLRKMLEGDEGNTVTLDALPGINGSEGCRGCHTFDMRQLALQSMRACRKHTRVIREGGRSCIECHDDSDLEDIYGHEM